MGRRARLCLIVVVVAISLLWLVLIAGIVVRPVQAYQRSAMSVQVTATVSPQVTTTQATPTEGQPTQQGKSGQNKQGPSWVTLSLLLIGCAVLLAFLVLLLWGRTHRDQYRKLRQKADGLLPWHQRGQPAGWTYEVLVGLLTGLALAAGLAAQVLAGSVSTGPAVFLIVAVALGLAASVVTLRLNQLKNERSWEQQVRGLSKVTLGADLQLPRLSTLNPYGLGVSSSMYGSEEQQGDDPYVPRVKDDELDQALCTKSLSE